MARGTPLWLGLFPLGSIICGALYIMVRPSILVIILGFIFLVLGVILVLFFRDPDRDIGHGVVSPADGKVIKVEPRGGGWWFVSIFMNIHNVHVNRSPWKGRVLELIHRSGGHRPAFDKDSDHNEKVIIKLRTENGTWEVTQIAGAVARRIVPYVSTGQELAKGERFGLIRFGSRVDLLFRLPSGMRIIVEPGQKVRAGRTEIAESSRDLQRKGGRR
ncbi:MAG: phosphatidylserine decarboxylase [Candidatus Thermoplasmatota archaeon]|nr:phosphatidylserine decarboxylase [Candidatus Thermoplasmatota archaeon]